MTDTNKTFEKSELLDKLKALLKAEETKTTHTDCEEYRKQGKTSAIEEIIELIENA